MWPVGKEQLTERRGGCHCGNLRLRLRLSQAPEETRLRACGCSFCRAHDAHDPAKSVSVVTGDAVPAR